MLSELGQAGDTAEITPAMVEAGAEIIREKSKFFEAEVLASLVYTAMLEASDQRAFSPA